MITRRFALKTMAAPVIVGFKVSADTLNHKIPDPAPGIWQKPTPLTNLGEIARRISERVALFKPHSPWFEMLNMREGLCSVETILREEARNGGLIENYMDWGHETQGRYWLARAVDEHTFLPKVAIFMYPSELGYEGGLVVKVECEVKGPDGPHI